MRRRWPPGGSSAGLRAWASLRHCRLLFSKHIRQRFEDGRSWVAAGSRKPQDSEVAFADRPIDAAGPDATAQRHALAARSAGGPRGVVRRRRPASGLGNMDRGGASLLNIAGARRAVRKINDVRLSDDPLCSSCADLVQFPESSNQGVGEMYGTPETRTDGAEETRQRHSDVSPRRTMPRGAAFFQIHARRARFATIQARASVVGGSPQVLENDFQRGWRGRYLNIARNGCVSDYSFFL